MITSLPCASSGTNGNGGAFITFAIVPSSSGDAFDSAMNPAIVSTVAGSMSIPPTTVSSSCRRNWNRVATPKLPPPRIAQNRSGSVSASTRRISPSAVTTSAASRSSIVRPCLRARYPIPPPSVILDPDRAGIAETDPEAVRVGRGAELAGGQSRLGPDGAPLDVDVERTQVGEVDHDPTVGHAVAEDAVAAAPDGELDAGLACQRDDP